MSAEQLGTKRNWIVGWLTVATSITVAGHAGAAPIPVAPGFPAVSRTSPEEGHKEERVPAPAQNREELQQEQLRTPGMVVTRAGATSVQVNTDAFGANIVGDAANEPSIAVDPTDPNRIVIGWRQFDTITNNFRQAGVAYSHDGGATWSNIGPLDPGQFRSDPVLRADNNGTFFYLSLSTVNTMEMFRSFDGGVTWPAPIPAFGGDKEWMTIDTTGGTGDGNIYTVWNIQFSCCDGEFSRSRDGGSTYSQPIQIPEPKMKWGTLDVGPDGEVYLGAATLDTQSHVFARSTRPYLPGAVNFDLVRNVDLGGRTANGGLVNPEGILGVVWTVADRSTQPTRGNVYMLGSVTAGPSDPMDVHFIRSVDRGARWSAPIRVNDDSLTNDAWQWFATMAVAPNGRIDVVWCDTRNAVDPPNSTMSELYYSYSLDAGHTWSPNVALTPPFDSTVGFPSQNKIGDYYDMLSDAGGANLTFSATFNGEEDVYFMRIMADCNGNGVPDDQDVLVGGMPDCNGNLIPDACEAADDCNGNSIQDVCELAGNDCNRNLILDACEDTSDCNSNTIQDICEIFAQTVPDCNANGIPDECDIASGYSSDNDATGIPDECENACCTCDGCIQTTEADCVSQGGLFEGGGTKCATTDCSIPNDTCLGAELLPSDTTIAFDYNNLCAADDGPPFELCDTGYQPFGADIWYEYTTPCCGELTVSLCDNTNYDAILSVFGGDATCTCPEVIDPSLVCGDDSCGVGAGPPTVTLPVNVGDCYLIRVGGWRSATGFGSFQLDMTCQTDDDGDGLCTAFDNCPDDHNPGQEDTDFDGLGDACDACPLDAANDVDGDTVCGDVDNCPTIANTNQTDSDSNGIGDACEPAKVYVDANATGANTGLDWANAFTDLQDGLDLAPTLTSPVPVEIWVADGTYVPSVPIDADPRTVTFSIPTYVRLLGGFAGGETLLSERDPTTNIAVLSGDIAQDDGAFPGNNGENAYTVVYFLTPGEAAEVDGFTITRGNSNGPGNFATEVVGGGVLFLDDEVSVTLRKCVITENIAVAAGGGVFQASGPTFPTTSLITDCLISNNVSALGAGMFVNGPATANILNTRFHDNLATAALGPGLGGGLYNVFSGGTSIVGCEFLGNAADVDGGAVYADLGNLTTSVINSTISGNTAARAGGVYNGVNFTGDAGFVNVRNSIVYGNTDHTGTSEPAQLASDNTGSFAVIHSCIEGLTGGLGGIGNIGLDPKFVEPGVNLRVEPSSPVVDAGLNIVIVTTDLDGNPRFFDGDGDGVATVDMGAYESQETILCRPAETPLAEAGGVKKSRYISMVPGNAGEQVALRVTLAQLDGFGSFVAETRWVGPPSDYPEEDSSDPNRTFVGAKLACNPHFRDWGTIDLLQVFGGEIMPNSTYEVQAVHESCADLLDDPDSFSAPLTIETGKWGDVTLLFEGDEPGVAQPDFIDIAALVAKFTEYPTAVIKAQAQLQPNVVIPDRPVDFKDIAADVRAFVGSAYVDEVDVSGPCVCPSSVTCGATECTSDLECADGYCIGGFCTDACGRCTP